MASPTARTTMPSADSCGAVRTPCDALSPEAGTPRRSPEVSSTAFATHPPDLQGRPLDGRGLRDPPLARPDRPASYPIPVRRVVGLLHASFRRPLAGAALAFRSHFTSIRLCRGLAPPSCRTCSAHGGPDAARVRVAERQEEGRARAAS